MIQTKPELTYVERFGNQRMVAGVLCQPRYIEGIDSEGRVWTRIQVKSVSSIALSHHHHQSYGVMTHSHSS